MFYFFGNNLRTHCLKDAEQVESPDTRGGGGGGVGGVFSLFSPEWKELTVKIPAARKK